MVRQGRNHTHQRPFANITTRHRPPVLLSTTLLPLPLSRLPHITVMLARLRRGGDPRTVPYQTVPAYGAEPSVGEAGFPPRLVVVVIMVLALLLLLVVLPVAGVFSRNGLALVAGLRDLAVSKRRPMRYEVCKSILSTTAVYLILVLYQVKLGRKEEGVARATWSRTDAARGWGRPS